MSIEKVPQKKKTILKYLRETREGRMRRITLGRKFRDNIKNWTFGRMIIVRQREIADKIRL